MRIMALILALGLWTGSASAQTPNFTQPEQDSLTNLAQARLRIARRMEDYGDKFKFGVYVGNADQFAEGRRLVGLSRACQLAARFLLGAKPDINQRRPPRTSAVNAGKSWVETCSLRAANLRFAEVVEKLRGVDLQLDYTEFKHSDWPTMVGPHGDADKGNLEANRAQRYVHHSMFDAVAYLEQLTNYNPVSAAQIGQLWVRFAQLSRALIQAQMIEAAMPLPVDQTRIDAYCAAGQGTRPCDFFRASIAAEHLYGNGRLNKPTIDGSRQMSGAALFYEQLTYSWQRILYQQMLTHGPTEVRCWFNLTLTHLGARGCGMAVEFQRDLVDSWRDVDGWAQSILAFHHASPDPPVPPGSVPPPQ